MTQFVLRRMFASLVIFWFWIDQTSTARKPYYRTSDFGRRFILAIPRGSTNDPLIVAKLTFMTYEYEASVTVSSPLHLTNRHAKYTEESFHTTNKSPITMNVTSSNQIKNVGTGNAMKITANTDILVMAVFCGQGYDRDTIVLPPTNSYAYRYTVLLPDGVPGFVLTLADHEYTIVTFTFKDNSSRFALTCDWNSTCAGVSGSSSLVLNATTYAFVSWGLRDFPTLTGSYVTSSRPVLVIAGLSQYRSMTVMPRPRSFSKQFVFALDCAGMNLLRKRYLCSMVTYKVFPMISYVPWYMRQSSKTTNANPGESLIFPRLFRYEIIITNVPVAVLAYAATTSRSKFMTIMVPESMWPSYTIISKPDISPGLVVMIQLIVQSDLRNGLLYNGKSMKGFKWEKYQVPFDEKYYDISDSVIYTASATVMQTDPRHTFLAYVRTVKYAASKPLPVYGMGTNFGMIYHRPEREDRYEYQCLPHTATLHAGDDVDNDCDNSIDEEMWNGQDDDGDGLIDEDLMTKRTKGQWGTWLPWHCGGACPSKEKGRLQRYRSCDNPPQRNKGGICLGSNLEIGNKTCELQCASIPESCALGLFGMACEDECPKSCAITVCGKERGQCIACIPGYRQPPFCQYLEYTPLPGVAVNLTDELNYGRQFRSSFLTTTQVIFISLGLLIVTLILIAAIEYDRMRRSTQIGKRKKKRKKMRKKEGSGNSDNDINLDNNYYDTHSRSSDIDMETTTSYGSTTTTTTSYSQDS